MPKPDKYEENNSPQEKKPTMRKCKYIIKKDKDALKLI